jgi:hypothetical protein
MLREMGGWLGGCMGVDVVGFKYSHVASMIYDMR